MTKYPVFKDVSGLWYYDYKAAEKRRFTGTEMWDPTRLSSSQVDQYLKALSYHWGAKSGLKEESTGQKSHSTAAKIDLNSRWHSKC